MGTLPTFLAISGFVFLVFMLSYSTIRSKAQQMKIALDRLQQLNEARKGLVAKYLDLADTTILTWPQEITDAHAFLRQQDRVLDQIDTAAVSAGLSAEGIEAFKTHFAETQEALDEYHQLVHQYNGLVTNKPNSYIAKATGFSTV